MRTGITVDVNAADRARLEAIVADRNSAEKHVWRARIVLVTGDGLGTNEIMRQTTKSETCLWRCRSGECRRVSRACCMKGHDLRAFRRSRPLLASASSH
jgi:hypothetical protein